MTSVEEVICRVDEWKDKKITYEEIPYGLTNRNYKLLINGETYFLRIPGEGTNIFIDRKVELHNAISASDIGVGAKVIKYFDSDYVVITEFINGRLMSSEIFRSSDEEIEKAVDAIKLVHEKAHFISRFVMFEKFSEYLEITRKYSMKLPLEFKKVREVVLQTQDIFLTESPSLVSCHNDLLAENFLDEGSRMRIIDWELSGLNDPMFELGDFSIEQELNQRQDRLIIETYFGNFREDKFCWLEVYRIMADILWTLWAVIQECFSDLDFDYVEYGSNRFYRALRVMESADFHYWLRHI